MNKPTIKVVIDVGNSRVRVVIAKLSHEALQPLTVLAVGMSNRLLLNNGIIICIPTLVAAIREAVSLAEKSAGLTIKSAILCISNAYIRGLNQSATVQINGSRITHNDVVRVVDAVKTKVKTIQPRDNLLHVIQQQFVPDDLHGVDDPVGMTKINDLTLQAHVISTTSATTENLCNAVEKSGIAVEKIIYSGLGASYFATTVNDRDKGICAIDLGAGTTDVVVWCEGYPVISFTLPIGGESVSENLADKLKTSRQNAEIIKYQYASLKTETQPDKNVRIISAGHRPDRHVPYHEVTEIVCASYNRIFSLLRDKFKHMELNNIPEGIIFTGGAAQVPGLAEAASQYLKFPAEVLTPPLIDNMPEAIQYDAGMTTALGMLKLQQDPLHDHVWVKEIKDGIIVRFYDWIRRYLLTEEG